MPWPSCRSAFRSSPASGASAVTSAAWSARDIRAFQGAIPGLLQTHVGENLSPRGRGYTYCGVMEFADQAALEAYVVHPAHQALLKWLVPLIDAVELDVEA